MNRSSLWSSAILVTSLFIAAPAMADFTDALSLNASKEVPPSGTAATGTGSCRIDTLANTLYLKVTHNVVGENACHIHGPAAVGVNAGVIFPLVVGPTKEVIWNYPENQQANILAGLTYVNIHSTAFPGGEIRDQIQPVFVANAVPSYTEWGLVALAAMMLFAGVLIVRRRRAHAA